MISGTFPRTPSPGPPNSHTAPQVDSHSSFLLDPGTASTSVAHPKTSNTCTYGLSSVTDQPVTGIQNADDSKTSAEKDPLLDFARVFEHCQASQVQAKEERLNGNRLHYHTFIRNVQDRILSVHACTDL